MSEKQDAEDGRERWVTVSDRMQRHYRYALSAPTGIAFDPDFKPELTPKQMLALGVFGGKYMTDCCDEFPATWFENAQRNCRRSPGAIQNSTISASTPVSRSRSGGRTAGCMRTIRAAGFSGTAAITSGGACPRRISGRSGAGRRFVGTFRRSRRTASRAIRSAGRGSDRRCSTGPTTAEKSDLSALLLQHHALTLRRQLRQR